MGVGRSWMDYFTIYALDLHQRRCLVRRYPDGTFTVSPDDRYGLLRRGANTRVYRRERNVNRFNVGKSVIVAKYNFLH